MVWLGLLVWNGPKLVSKLIIKANDSQQTVGDIISQTMDNQYQVLSVRGHNINPGKLALSTLDQNFCHRKLDMLTGFLSG